MACRFLLYFFTFCLIQGTFAQRLRYDAYKKDDMVGHMDVMVLTEGQRQTFDIESSMDFRFLISLKVRFHNHEVFDQGILEHGQVDNQMIGFKESHATIKRQINGYHLLINDKHTPVEAQRITYTVAKIYTQEPYNGQMVYSPYYGAFFTFEKVGPNEYRYSAPEGDNFYAYHEGVCTEVRLERDFATIRFKLKPEVLAAVKSNAANFRSND
ncbi:MAG: DUF6134 family protein [Bacteroidota bacterium]